MEASQFTSDAHGQKFLETFHETSDRKVWPSIRCTCVFLTLDEELFRPCWLRRAASRSRTRRPCPEEMHDPDTQPRLA